MVGKILFHGFVNATNEKLARTGSTLQSKTKQIKLKKHTFQSFMQFTCILHETIFFFSINFETLSLYRGNYLVKMIDSLTKILLMCTCGKFLLYLVFYLFLAFVCSCCFCSDGTFFQITRFLGSCKSMYKCSIV